MKKFSKQAFRPLARKALLWALRLAAVAAFILFVFLIQHLWQQLSDRQHFTSEKHIDRNVGKFSLDDSLSKHNENVRWVNLFLDDVIITGKHPVELHVESAPAAMVDKAVALDEGPSKEGEEQSASSYQNPPPPVFRQHMPHDSGEDEEADSLRERRLSLRASLQGIKRFGLLARLPISAKWSLETGLAFGHLKTTDNRHWCFSLPLHAIYHVRSVGPVDLYALGGTTFEKVCKGHTSLQLMLQAGVGAEYQFKGKWSKWGVFLEPSLRYHVGNDSNIPSLYGKRLGMNIHFGITFTP